MDASEEAAAAAKALESELELMVNKVLMFKTLNLY